jgi:uncharacterized membrane protein
MTLLIIGLVLFLGSHSIAIINTEWRNRIVDRVGILAWQGIYSLFAIAGIVMIIQGYAIARENPVILYHPPFWLHELALLLLIFVFPLLFAAYLPGRIRTITKHPMLVATKIWALAHLLANGSLADVILFGSFLVWAVADRISLKRRSPLSVPSLPSSRVNDAIAVVLGLALYLAFIFGVHAWLFGVSPI